MLKKWIKIFIPFYSQFIGFRKAGIHGSYFQLLKFKVGIQKRYWPKDKTCTLANESKIYVGKCCLIGRPGVYIQGAGKVYFGDYVQLAPNVGILSSNHDLYDQTRYIHQSIKIGDYSWIGMNSVVLAGIELGPRTIVGAGSVVTKSFPEGFCVIGGNPAKIIKLLDKDKFVPWSYQTEYYGFVPKEEFENNKGKYTNDILQNEHAK